MVSARLGSRLGVVKSSKLEDVRLSRRSPVSRRPAIATTGGPNKKVLLGIINNHLTTNEKDKVKLTKSTDSDKKSAPITAVSKTGSRIQVVRRSSPSNTRSRSPKRSLSSRSMSYGGMRCDMEEHRVRKPMFHRTHLKTMKFEVKSLDSELIGIDLKKVSLKRKIKNDDSTTEMGKYGEIKRTVPNKKEKRSSSIEDGAKEPPKDSVNEPVKEASLPRKASRSTGEKEKGRAIYKTALNDLMENRKKTKSDQESRKRVSRNKVKEIKEKPESSDSDSPVPIPSPAKRKKPSKKVQKKASSSEESESPDEKNLRRPGERGKSAIKDIPDEADDDAHSPVEGYRLKVSNLNNSVSESDLVDLFCAIGAIRDAKLTADPGSAIITFVKRAAAMAAITKYNGRELDKQKISVSAHRVMDLPPKKQYQWRNEYPTKKPRDRQEVVGEISNLILPPALAGVMTPDAKPVVFTVKV